MFTVFLSSLYAQSSCTITFGYVNKKGKRWAWLGLWLFLLCFEELSNNSLKISPQFVINLITKSFLPFCASFKETICIFVTILTWRKVYFAMPLHFRQMGTCKTKITQPDESDYILTKSFSLSDLVYCFRMSYQSLRWMPGSFWVGAAKGKKSRFYFFFHPIR